MSFVSLSGNIVSSSYLPLEHELTPGLRRLRPIARTRQPGRPPSAPNALIGREGDVATARAMLVERGVRLLTLTGPGGVGKTRLAMQIAHEVADAFVDGVVFVSLAAITDPALVLPTVMRTLGLRQGDGRVPAEVVADMLCELRLLLVLDNFEQVRPAAREVSALLEACPGVSVLVTSRVRLHLSGEQRVPVTPLALPLAHRPGNGTQRHLVEAANESPAVQLFVVRAQAVDPGFALGPENAAAVAAICQQLDGLPLAIELAAARGVLLSPNEILARLHPALQLLTGGPDDAPNRHQTMREAIAWSFGLLSPHEQTLFQTLAVFQGGFTLDEVEGLLQYLLADDGGDAGNTSPETAPPAGSTFESLASLVETSLLQRTLSSSGARFGMLETIREFAQEQLEASGDGEGVRRAHARYFAHVTEEARARIHGPEGASVLDRLEIEHDNLRAALAWTIDANEVKLALRLTQAAWRFWWMRSHLDQGRAWLERVVAMPDTDREMASLRALTMVAAGYFARIQGDYARASELGEAALAVAHDINDAYSASSALHLLSLTATDRGELGEACAHLEAGIAIDRSAGYTHGVAYGLSDLADVALVQGKSDDAAQFANEALAIWQAQGDAWGVARAQVGRGKIARAQGDGSRAVSHICESLKACITLGDKEIAARGISELAVIAVERGDLQLAAQFCGSVAALRDAIGAPVALAERASHEALVARIRAGLPANVFSSAWEVGFASSLEEVVTTVAAYVTSEGSPPTGKFSARNLLTPREREVLEHLARGWSDKEIAAELYIGQRTVSSHVAAILAKLKVSSRAAAVAIALRDGGY